VDGGAYIDRYLVPVYIDDSIAEVAGRLLDSQNVVLPDLMQRLNQEPVPVADAPLNIAGDMEMAARAERQWNDYRARWAVQEKRWRCICKNGFEPPHCACGRTYTNVGPLLREKHQA